MTQRAPNTDAPGETEVQLPRGSSTGYPGTPRWVKMSGIIALVLILLVILVMVLSGGEHGPLRHVPSGSGGSWPPPIAVGV